MFFKKITTYFSVCVLLVSLFISGCDSGSSNDDSDDSLVNPNRLNRRIEISADSATIELGAMFDFTASFSGFETTPNHTWVVATPAVATVNASGTVKGLSLGTTTVSVYVNSDVLLIATAAVTILDKTISFSESIPRDFSATKTLSSEIRLTWSEVFEATSYEIYRSTSQGGSYTKIGTSLNTSFNDITATEAVNFFYKIKALNSDLSSEFSSEVSGRRVLSVLSVPNNFSATNRLSSGIKLTWSEVPEATSYEIYRSFSILGSYIKIKTTSSLSFSDSTTSAGTVSFYKIKAINSNLSSEFSSIVNGLKLFSGVPERPTTSTTPTNLVASTDRRDAIIVSCTPVTGALSYSVYRVQQFFGSNLTFFLGTTVDSEFKDTSAPTNVIVSYQMQALTSAGLSDLSASVSGFRLP